MKKTHIITIFVVIVLIILLSVFRNNKNDESYSIGAIVPLSGGAANIGQFFAMGMHLAVEEINNVGGVNGNKIILEVEDGEFLGTKSISSAHKLMETINPDVFDVLFALPAQALSPVFEKEGKPFFAWDYSRSVVDGNEFAFKTGFDAKTGCADLVKYAKDKNMYKNLGVLMSRTPYNESCFAGIKTVEENVKEYWYEFGSDDFRSLLAKANVDGVDMLATIMVDPEPIQIFKQINDLNLPLKIICFTSSECIYDRVKSVASPNILKGTVAVDFVPEDLLESDFASLFRNKYPESANETSITWGAQGYDDVLIIVEAMKQCEPKDSKCLLKALGNVGEYKSPINSDGFNNRIQKLDLRKQMYNGNVWVDLLN